MSTTKPIKEWLAELPDGYRERALANYNPEYRDVEGEDVSDGRSPDYALRNAFFWDTSPEGCAFWDAVCDWARDKSVPLPPLPANPHVIAPGHNPDKLTNEQAHSIVNELCKLHGCTPELVVEWCKHDARLVEEMGNLLEKKKK